MSDTSVITRESIAMLAEAAAKVWVERSNRDANTPKPSNPYSAQSEPEHHKQWACDFERFLVKHSARLADDGEAA